MKIQDKSPKADLGSKGPAVLSLFYALEARVITVTGTTAGFLPGRPAVFRPRVSSHVRHRDGWGQSRGVLGAPETALPEGLSSRQQ